MVKNNANLKIGLFFGSFNPIHTGHLVIANHMVEFTDVNQVWFVISPHNPFKEKGSLLADHHRLAMVTIAVENDARFKASNIEFHLPQPSYTIDTLTYLKEKYPEKAFVVIAGADQLPSFHKWKNWETLLEHYEVYVYPRPGFENIPEVFVNHPSIKIVNAPIMEISSSFIRQTIKEGKRVDYLLPEKVYRYVQEMHFYEK